MAAPLPPLVITGASGFVGRRVVDALRGSDATDAAAARAVTLLVRDAAAFQRDVLPAAWRVVACDLAREAPPAGAIPRGGIVVHLAAATGRLSPAVMREVNVEGTRRLVEACVAAGAAQLVFISSIAAAFPDRRWYHYAEAKRDAERIVAMSGLPFIIVRPTMVFGHGSPVQEGLERLALGGAPIVLGSGRVQVQPVHVDDLARFLVALSEHRSEAAATVDVGGPDRVAMRTLLARMRAAHSLPARELRSIPLAIPRQLLALAERIVGTRLPVTAGQLASFVNDSCAQPSDVVERLMPAPRHLGDMLHEHVAATKARDERPGIVGRVASLESGEQLAREFAVFASYLGSAAPGARAAESYQRTHASIAPPSDTFDRWLVALARQSPMACALADAYARLARPYGTLRCKLVLTLAVLESSPALHRQYDTARPSGSVVAWSAIVVAGLGWMGRSAIAAMLLAPLQLVARCVPDAAPESPPSETSRG
ncbi:MAG: NAD(P)-dependent oxidoreductase [Gemmatimonadota bacterium]